MQPQTPATPTDQRYRLSFDRAAVGLAHFSLDGRWLAVNPAYCQLLGYSQEELLALTFRDVAYPEDLAGGEARAGRLLRGEVDTYSLEARYRRKDGSTVWVEVSAALAKHDDGTPDFFIASAIDITKRKAVEATLVRTNDRYLRSTSAAQVGTWDWNLDTNLFFWSPSSAAIFGVEPSDGPIDPELAFSTVHPDDLDRLRRTIEQGVARGEYECEFRGLRPDGSVRWVLGRGKAVYDGQGRPVHFYGINIDITEQHETQLRLAEAIRARDEFIAAASHELRTPLASMSLQIGAMAHVPSEKLPFYIQLSQRQVKRLSRLVENMLDVSRLTDGNLRLQPAPTELRGMVNEAVQQLWPQVSRENREIRVFADAPVVGEWDAPRLEQVVVNLINNALKYAPESPIEISLSSDGEQATLSVRDYGKGIAAEMQKRIFERFERADREDRSGLGLGLYIASQIVRLHGGTIRVESEPGHGANFIVELPLRAPTS